MLSLPGLELSEGLFVGGDSFRDEVEGAPHRFGFDLQHPGEQVVVLSANLVLDDWVRDGYTCGIC